MKNNAAVSSWHSIERKWLTATSSLVNPNIMALFRVVSHVLLYAKAYVLFKVAAFCFSSVFVRFLKYHLPIGKENDGKFIEKWFFSNGIMKNGKSFYRMEQKVGIYTILEAIEQYIFSVLCFVQVQPIFLSCFGFPFFSVASSMNSWAIRLGTSEQKYHKWTGDKEDGG